MACTRLFQSAVKWVKQKDNKLVNLLHSDMAAIQLDDIDRRLLRAVQRDNRKTLRTLADEIGISAPTCLRRLRRLESAGVIRAHMAIVDPTRLGFGVLAYVEVVLVAPSGAEIRQFERRMQRCAEVVQCSELAGDVDYLLTVRVSDLPAFADFTRRHLADDRSVKSYRSLLVMRQTKNELTVPA